MTSFKKRQGQGKNSDNGIDNGNSIRQKNQMIKTPKAAAGIKIG